MRVRTIERVADRDDTLHQTVLIAASDSATRRHVSDALRLAGITVSEAPTYQAALDRLWSDPTIDVVVVSPHLAGGSATRLIGTARAALGRCIEALFLAPSGTSATPDSVDPGDVAALLRRTGEGLGRVADHRLGQGLAPVATRIPLNAALASVFDCLAVAAEAKDCDAGLHNRRIGLYAKVVADAMELPREVRAVIEVAAKLHDIGKIAIDDRLLDPAHPLSPDDRVILQRHTVLGHDILAAAWNPPLRIAAGIARHHHECWNGGGYPDGLQGRQIPVAARITKLGDVYDRLRAPRHDKPALDHPAAIAVLMNGDARTRPEHFDPAILALLPTLAPSFERIYATLSAKL